MQLHTVGELNPALARSHSLIFFINERLP
jgi:hypothetical protein